MSDKVTVEVSVQMLDADELDGALADMSAHAVALFTNREDPTSTEPLTVARRAQTARWLAETALALAIHFEVEHRSQS